MQLVCAKAFLLGGAQSHPTAMPPVLVLEKIEKIEAELTSINSMLKKLTDTNRREEQRRFGVVTVRGLQHIFVPWGTTIRTATENQAMTQTSME